jgi:tagatose 6-phosphate kinase
VWRELVHVVAATAGRGDVVTVSGSLPPATPDGVVADLVHAARTVGAVTVLDVSGPALAAALAAGPDVVSPNRAEAEGALAGEGHLTAASAARALVTHGARAAVVSDGAEGLVACHGDLLLRARLPRALRGNATGAGDALTAALAAGLHELGGLPGTRPGWEAVLRRAVAWSGAAVLQAVAGQVEPADADALLPSATVEEIHA